MLNILKAFVWIFIIVFVIKVVIKGEDKEVWKKQFELTPGIFIVGGIIAIIIIFI